MLKHGMEPCVIVILKMVIDRKKVTKEGSFKFDDDEDQ